MPAAKSLQAVGFDNMQSKGKEQNPSIFLPRVWQQLSAVNSQIQDPEVRGEEVTKPPGDAIMLMATCPCSQPTPAAGRCPLMLQV